MWHVVKGKETCNKGILVTALQIKVPLAKRVSQNKTNTRSCLLRRGVLDRIITTSASIHYMDFAVLNGYAFDTSFEWHTYLLRNGVSNCNIYDMIPYLSVL